MHTQIPHSVRKCVFPCTKYPPRNETQRFEMLPVRTHTKMAAIHHGFLFGFGFLFPAASSFSMASKAATLTPGLFCVNKSFGTSTAMRDRRQRRHWQLLSSSCWSSLFLWPCSSAFISLSFCATFFSDFPPTVCAEVIHHRLIHEKVCIYLCRDGQTVWDSLGGKVLCFNVCAAISLRAVWMHGPRLRVESWQSKRGSTSICRALWDDVGSWGFFQFQPWRHVPNLRGNFCSEKKSSTAEYLWAH